MSLEVPHAQLPAWERIEALEKQVEELKQALESHLRPFGDRTLTLKDLQ